VDATSAVAWDEERHEASFRRDFIADFLRREGAFSTA